MIIKIANGLKMYLAKQNLDEWLVSILKNRIAAFLEQKKNQIATNALRAFSITRGSKIFSIRSDSYYILNTSWKIILDDKFQPEACKFNPLLRNLEYNNNSTQNQDVFQLTTRNLFSIT